MDEFSHRTTSLRTDPFWTTFPICAAVTDPHSETLQELEGTLGQLLEDFDHYIYQLALPLPYRSPNPPRTIGREAAIRDHFWYLRFGHWSLTTIVFGLSHWSYLTSNLR
jgi:hypothetical protein